MIEGLDQDLVFVAFLEDVADRVLGNGAGGDQTLPGAFEGQVRRVGMVRSLPGDRAFWSGYQDLTRAMPELEKSFLISGLQKDYKVWAGLLHATAQESAQGRAQSGSKAAPALGSHLSRRLPSADGSAKKTVLNRNDQEPWRPLCSISTTHYIRPLDEIRL